MAALKKLLTHLVSLDDTSFQLPPHTIVNTDTDSEITQVKNGSTLLWGKYRLLMEDDYGGAYEIDEVDADPSCYNYTWGDFYPQYWVEAIRLYTYNDQDSTEAYFAAKNILSNRELAYLYSDYATQNNLCAYFSDNPTLGIAGSPVHNPEQNRIYTRVYQGEQIRADVKVKPGFYLESQLNNNSNSYGNNSTVLVLADSVSEDFVLDNDIRVSLGVRPKYGTLSLTLPSTLSTRANDCKRLSSLESMTNIEDSPSYTTVPLNGLISNGSKLYFKDKIQLAFNNTNSTWGSTKLGLPEPNALYTFRLDQTSAEQSSYTNYLRLPNSPITLSIPNSYAMYPDSSYSFSYTSQSYASKSYTGYCLTSNKTFHINSLFDFGQYPITLTTNRPGIKIKTSDLDITLDPYGGGSTFTNSSATTKYKTYYTIELCEACPIDLTSANAHIVWNPDDIFPGDRVIYIGANSYSRTSSTAATALTTSPTNSNYNLSIYYTLPRTTTSNKLMRLNLANGATTEIKPTVSYSSSPEIQHTQGSYYAYFYPPTATINLPLYTNDEVVVTYSLYWYHVSEGQTGASEIARGTISNVKTFGGTSTFRGTNLSIDFGKITTDDLDSGNLGILESSNQYLDCYLDLTIQVPNRGVSWDYEYNFIVDECYYTNGTAGDYEKHDCF